MTLRSDLQTRVNDIASSPWNVAQGRVVPELQALPHANSGKTLSACLLYADLSDSTGLVSRLSATRAAEYYKAFLHCASRLITIEGGVIEAYDGDRVLGVYLGASKEEHAVNTAFRLTRAMATIVNPTFERIYRTAHEPLKFTVGIDTGEVMVCKAGVRGDSDLIWVGTAANYAAKLNSFAGLDHDYPVRASRAVVESLPVGLRTQMDGGAAWHGPYNDTGIVHYRSATWLEV
ncbi:class 3 adenylate cyclase [Stenotrophomonas sp. SORGH_AS 282]|jgi:class 3 adenylate cyclase|nr:class 3 adenylate cyclase [Stenotrophomonas sp. SORGH_AS_0282]